jgi:hypothetical protein
MAERSQLWVTGTYGDGVSSYSMARVDEMFRALFTSDNAATQGVFKGYLNELAVTGTSSPVAVNTGAAVVYGKLYFNSASVNVAVGTPVVGTTGHRVVLRATWGVTQTVRIALVSSADGTADIPAVTQTADTLWEITLATLTITTGGVITVTDARAYVSMPSMFDGSNAPDAVDDTIVGNRVLALTKRQGGNATAWGTAGVTDYTPTMVRMQCGVLREVNATGSGSVTATFPIAFSDTPIVIVELTAFRDRTDRRWLSYTATASEVTIYWKFAGSGSQYRDYSWLAIGPE